MIFIEYAAIFLMYTTIRLINVNFSKCTGVRLMNCMKYLGFHFINYVHEFFLDAHIRCLGVVWSMSFKTSDFHDNDLATKRKSLVY